ncbi:MAG: DNA-processing protein DprA [Candidatus Bipolaricaulota bacterium]
MEDRMAWLALNMLPSLTPRRLRALLGVLGGPCEIMAAPVEKLARAIGPEAARRIARERSAAQPQQEVRRARHAGAHIVTLADGDFPEVMRELPTPPLVLYVLGKLEPADVSGVAIVGTRRCTSYGRLVARKMGTQLAERGVTVISGMAPGVDAAAHQGALSGGRTVAILGTGLGKPYPAGVERRLQAIAEKGAVLSEYPWETPGAAWTFPRRNRLIAGLCKAVLVVEAPIRSGALITAERALEQGKDVLAVPGPITSEASAGTNRLLQDGASPVTCVEDVVEELGGVGKHHFQPSLPLPTGDALTVYEALSSEMLDTSELMAHTGLSHALVSQALLELQMAGLVEEQPGRRYARI